MYESGQTGQISTYRPYWQKKKKQLQHIARKSKSKKKKKYHAVNLNSEKKKKLFEIETTWIEIIKKNERWTTSQISCKFSRQKKRKKRTKKQKLSATHTHTH